MTTDSSPRNNARKTRGRPFAAGNKGRPKGARNRVSLAVEALLDGQAEALTQKAIALALEGDTVALRLCLERLTPARKDRPVIFDLPKIEGVQDLPAALGAVLAAVAAGQLTPMEAQAFADLMENHRRAVETTDLADRLRALEEERDHGHR